MTIRQQQVLAAAKAMWRRDWEIVEDADEERLWGKEPKSVRYAYTDLARRALMAAAMVRERAEVETPAGEGNPAGV